MLLWVCEGLTFDSKNRACKVQHTIYPNCGVQFASHNIHTLSFFQVTMLVHNYIQPGSEKGQTYPLLHLYKCLWNGIWPLKLYLIIIIFGLGSSSAFYPLEALQPVWLTPEVYCTIPHISNRSYSGHQVPLTSTTRSSLLAARGGTMGGNSGQMMTGICTQGSLTYRKSATWDR
jgi:hypothetical protein